ncbi:MAG: Stk1 family PASTA domain-containing Ser/Thr kinase [Clostridia bacterium]|nr:Stk1 family PASTA domain-containing Ser/Thr kinase [Clostridia bacterium]MDD4145849.1 Stk1 family PASTA domain-containing Ser/Thr kinase [Clostridia bacterium]MDD4665062.1 Stk1 family PASTA domain-containing Ser/Thr kinase [Clostridia bacterium]
MFLVEVRGERGETVIGKLLGNRYELLEQVGGGGMALVYRAKDVYLNRIVAIKILREQFTSDEEFVTRFRREAQAVASLSHHNIVSIYDVGQDGGTYYLVMEMVEGRDLKALIKEKSPFSTRETVELATQICDALAHAHEHQIIHRDIKPHNIIITSEGKAKVTDFGLARAVSMATVTHTGNIMGSVHYFSPEQARGEIADEKSDIYSLGVVLYEMVTGKLPFEGESPISIALSKIQNDPVVPSEINPQIGEALEKVILRAMAKDPRKRYASISELRRNLLSAGLYNRVENDGSIKAMEDTIVLPRLRKEEQGKTEKSNLAAPLKLWTWVMVALLIVGFLLGMYLSATVLAKGEVAVPDLANKTMEEAGRELEQYGLILVSGQTIHHPTLAEGLIISQTPKAEEIVKKNGKIEVTISKGPLMVEVPPVLDISLAAAEIALSNQGLLSDPAHVYHNQIAVGHVVHQDPEAGQTVAQGTTVKLIISKGPQPVWIKMPQLTGYSLTEAKSILESNSLDLGVVQPETSYRYPKEIVLRQDPGAESEILQGMIVNLVVSAGPGPEW